ncbi:MAG: superinfection exclusion B family protein [Nitrospinota bacterium]
MMENLLNWVKAPKHLAWPLVIVSGLLLWGPDAFKNGLGLEPFINEYRKWLGVVFLFFLIVGLQPIAPFVTQKVKEKYKRLESEKRAKIKINDLTPGEKAILKYYIKNNTRTQDLSIQDGDVSKLISDGFLYLASQVSYGGMRGSFTFPVNITDWAWNYIRRNPDVLE